MKSKPIYRRERPPPERLADDELEREGDPEERRLPIEDEERDAELPRMALPRTEDPEEREEDRIDELLDRDEDGAE